MAAVSGAAANSPNTQGENRQSRDTMFSRSLPGRPRRRPPADL